MTKELTKTERRVLIAIDRMDEYDAEQHAKDWPDDPPVVGFLRGLDSIHTGVKHLTFGRRTPGVTQVYDALQKLAARGLVERTPCGLGFGTTTLYIRRREGAKD